MQVSSASHRGHDAYRFSSVGGIRRCSPSAMPSPATPRLSPAIRPVSSPEIRPTPQYLSKPVFCCSSYRPYRPTHTDEENKFDTFLTWLQDRGSSTSASRNYVIQAIKQVNFGPVQEIRYFWRTPDGFEEVTEAFVKYGGLTKKNTYKTSNVRYTTSSSKSTCIKKMLSASIPGSRTQVGQQVKLTLAADGQAGANMAVTMPEKHAT